MKKALIRLTGLLVTTAIALSGNGLVLANEVENTGDDVVTATEEPANAAQDENSETPEEKSSDKETVTNTDSGSQAKDNNDGPSDNKVTVTETLDVTFDFDNDELAESYINHVFGIDSPKASTKKAAKRSYDPTSGLTESQKALFNGVKDHIVQIAAGNETSTIIQFASDSVIFNYSVDNLKDAKDLLKQDISVVIRALLVYYPYDLYWFDKTNGSPFSYSYSSTDNSITFYLASIRFSVAEEYRKTEGDLYTVGTTFSNTVETAHNNALSIVNTYKDLDDYKKLEAYKNKICDLVEYNHPAADNDDTAYGNPWQLIWVFDGNDSTTVVCEGYSKAFQYLCDNTDFSSNDIYTVCVSGDVVLRSNKGNVTGPHMWNVVHMEDGKNYLVDVTNCDSGCLLFMKGYVGTLSNGYVVSNGLGQNNDYPYRNTSLAPALASSDYVYTPSPEEAPKFAAHAMRLRDNIGLSFYIEFPEDFDPTNCYVTFSSYDGRTGTVSYEESVSVGNNQRDFTFFISPLGLSDNVTATLHYGNNKIVTSEPYSAYDYIVAARSYYASYPKVVNLINSLHAYGYYLQKSGWGDKRSHGTIPDPVKALSADEIAAAKTAINAFSIEKNIGTSGVDEKIMTDVSVATTTELRLYVTATEGTTIIAPGANTAVFYNKTYYQFSTGRIGPKALGTPRTVTVTTNKGTATFKTSTMYYVKSAMINSNLTDNQTKALVALYYYYSSALEYN
jgi:hypothetical protein